jgi:hypothetical protein
LKSRFTCKFDEYRSLYSTSTIVNDNLDEDDEEDEDSLFPVPKRFRNDNGHDELNSYLNSTQEPGAIDILEWWRSHESNYPTLARMARDYLVIPATSAPVERLFSESGNVITSERNRLGSDVIRATTLPYQKSSAVTKTQQLNCIISASSGQNFMILGSLDSP